MNADTLLRFWAKKREESDGVIHYPLLSHMLDTALVARGIWDFCLQAGGRRFSAEHLGIDEKQAAALISFWAGLHDIGKASPGFQCKDDKTKLWLRQAGFDTVGTEDHGTVTTYLLRKYLGSAYGPDLSRNIATAVGGHHGIFPRSDDVNRTQPGKRGWPEIQRQLFESFREMCDADSLSSATVSPTPAFLMFLAGLTCVSDWIASNETFFPIDPTRASLSEHKTYARMQAEKALTELGWTGWYPPPDVAGFQQLFRFDEERPLQTEVMNLVPVIKDRPGLVIIEAPMGEGKTEAAIYLADSWAVTLRQKGCYFALPTMATSDQMFGRVKHFLENRYHDQTVNLMLLHGHAALSAEFDSQLKSFRPGGIFGPGGDDGVPAGVVASEWFTYRKRGLLAPFGIGTIDQVLLAVLQTRHVFVRLFGLAGKTVIIDEVHAYDTYMTTLLERLVEWLAALGTSVVMLSATLPRERKNALLEAYVRGLGKRGADTMPELTQTSYPRISWTAGEQFNARSFDASPQSSKKLHIQWVGGALPDNGSEFELGRRLKEALSNGGCAAVICNTVDRAQKVYLALKSYFPETADDDQPVLDLLHARYLFGDRRSRQERSEVRFGKPGLMVHCQDGSERPVRRPNKAVIVATQVIEQSLDLDFDLMVTDMAPGDLLLQRAGRLHRHPKTAQDRHNLKEPVLWVCQPEMAGEVPDFGGGTEAVYDYYILLRTWLAIRDKDTIEIPGEVEKLVEAVYNNRDCPGEVSGELRRKWEESRKDTQAKKTEYESRAKQNRILPPDMDAESLLETFNKQLEEDDPTQNRNLQALTRYSEEPTIPLICLFGSMDKPSLDVSGSEVVGADLKPNVIATKKLLMRSVSVSNRQLVSKLIQSKEQCMVREGWREVSQLRHHFILFFDENHECIDFGVHLHEELGLVLQMKNNDS